MSLENILAVDVDDLSDHGRDELYTTLAWFDTDGEKIGSRQFRRLFKVTQEILKYKGEQVESLISELDSAAIQQGESEAKLRELQNEIGQHKAGSHRSSSDDVDRHVDELHSKNKEQKKVIDNQKRQIEKLTKEVQLLEHERLELQNQIQSGTMDSDTQSDATDPNVQQQKELTEMLRQKNRQISHLLTDVENVERENVVLHEKLATVRDELADTTLNMNKVTDELTSLKATVTEKIENIKALEDQNYALRSQVEELNEQKEAKDAQIEEFNLALDKRIDEYKRVLENKQSQIEELQIKNAELEKFQDSEAEKQIPLLMEAVAIRDEQIQELQLKLQQATAEMETTTTLLQQIAKQKETAMADSDEYKLTEILKVQLESANERCRELQQRIAETEEEARIKGQELSEVFVQMREYESGQFGLAEAMAKVQNLQKQVRLRDKQVCELVQTSNELQLQCDHTEQENQVLREKLGMSPQSPVRIDGIISKQRKQERLIKKLQNQTSLLEGENLEKRVELQEHKRKIQHLCEQITLLGANPDEVLEKEIVPFHNRDVFDYKEHHAETVEENEALRKGLREILDSVTSLKETGSNEIKSETLEKLLHALDERHVAGWYHPAMRLQAEVHSLRGSNAELREQLRTARLDVNRFAIEIKNLKAITPVRDTRNQTNLPDLQELTIQSFDDSKLYKHLLHVLNEYHIEERLNKVLLKNLESLKIDYETVQHQITVLYEQHISEKQSWETKYQNVGAENKKLVTTVTDLKAQIVEYRKHYEADKKTLQLIDRTADFIVLNRKYIHLEEVEKRFSAEVKKLQKYLTDAEVAATNKIKHLVQSKDEYKLEIKRLEHNLKNSIPVDEFNELHKKYNEQTLKYTELLQNKIYNFGACSQDDVLVKQIDMLRQEKQELFNLLQKESTHSHEYQNSDDLNKKLAVVEMKEIAERQRADHTNSLYELVKEQLKKSEERFHEVENHNKFLTQVNLKLQQNVKELQDQSVKAVDYDQIQVLENKLAKLDERYMKLVNENNILKDSCTNYENRLCTIQLWKSSQEFELLSLKHQVLDLQSGSDDKAVIAKLSSEVVLARLSEAESRAKVETLTSELTKINDKQEKTEQERSESMKLVKNITNEFAAKFAIMEHIIRSFRLQYYGSIPIPVHEKYLESLRQVAQDKADAFKKLQIAETKLEEAQTLKAELQFKINVADEFKDLMEKQDCDDIQTKLLEWYGERNELQIKELKHVRMEEFQHHQLNQASERIRKQDDQITHLEEELIRMAQLTEYVPSTKSPIVKSVSSQTLEETPKTTLKTFKDLAVQYKIPYSDKEAQTLQETGDNSAVAAVKEELKHALNFIAMEGNKIQMQQTTISELENTVASLRAQLNEKTKQLMNQRQSETQRTKVNVIDEIDMNVVEFQETVNRLQTVIAEKENSIAKYQALLKDKRDEYSLATVRSQEEIRKMQDALAEQQQAYESLKNSQLPLSVDLPPGKAAIEHYVRQVHSLEQHAAELHTSVTSLSAQLQASREEASRWKTLANDRLNSMEQLHEDLEKQHQSELEVYKVESNRLRQEVSKLSGGGTQKQLEEKDQEIRDLKNTLQALQKHLKDNVDDADVVTRQSPQVTTLESAKQQLQAEHDVLKKRFDQIFNKERSARDEIRNLKEQLAKRTLHSARSDRSADRQQKEQRLQKKVASLEAELEDVRQQLEKQTSLNEAHRIKVAEDFANWDKQKRWQETNDKLKEKLKTKTEELNKLQASHSGIRSVVSRLEREKNILESRLRSVKGSTASIISKENIEVFEIENMRLKAEIETLTAKLEMQHHHSGGLGAAMLHEKLEAQERKIAVLEIASKGSADLVAEIERLQANISSLQKVNLRLESENLELRLDLEKVGADAPHLREQVHHLEKYIEVLKAEGHGHVVSNSSDQRAHKESHKKLEELEKTVFVLKRVVEKLQAENKRLLSGRPCTSRSVDDKIKLELDKVRIEYENHLLGCRKLNEELKSVKEELSQKSQLLDKVKMLLHRAAVKERALQDQVTILQEQMHRQHNC